MTQQSPSERGLHLVVVNRTWGLNCNTNIISGTRQKLQFLFYFLLN